MQENNFHLVNTNKFKNWSIQIIFSTEICEKEETLRAMISPMLIAGTKTFPTKAAILDELLELYDAQLRINTRKIGESNVVLFELLMIKDEYLEEPIARRGLELLQELIYHPYLEEGLFSKKALKQTKEEYLELIKIRNQNKPEIASLNLLKKIFPKEKISADPLKNAHRIQQVNVENLYQAYQKMLQENRMDIVVEGASAEIVDLVKEYFLKKQAKKVSIVKEYQIIPKKKIIRKIMDTTQNNLAICYGNLPLAGTQDSVIGSLLCVMLGGFPNSLLFQVIREKHHLAYDISARYDSYHGLCFVRAGVTLEHGKIALKLIDEQIEFLRTQDCSELLNMAKEFLVHMMIEGTDSIGYLSSREYLQTMLGNQESLEDRIKRIQGVTPQEIMMLAKQIVKYGTSVVTKKGEVL